MLTAVEVLQGGRDLENSSTSKRPTTVGSNDGYLPLRDGV